MLKGGRRWVFIDLPRVIFHRYSDNTIEALEMLDSDEKIDLELILALIRYIVLNEEVSVSLYFWLSAGA